MFLLFSNEDLQETRSQVSRENIWFGLVCRFDSFGVGWPVSFTWFGLVDVAKFYYLSSLSDLSYRKLLSDISVLTMYGTSRTIILYNNNAERL